MATTKKKKKERPLAASQDDDLAAMLGDSLGKAAVRFLADPSFDLANKGVISTRCPPLDAAIGRGGLPLSRLSIISGKEASGKTSLCLHLCAETQALGGSIVYFDMEHKMDPTYAAALGVDTSKIIFPQVRTLEQVIKGVKSILARVKERRLKGKDRPTLIVLDSISACQTKETLEGEEGDRQYPNEARVWSKELPSLMDLLSTERCALIGVSQIRQKLNVTFGNDEQLAGGNAWRFHASLIMSVRLVGTERNSKKEKTASIVHVECMKNQVSAPFKKAKFLIRYGHGVDYEDGLLTVCEEAGIVTRKAGGGVYKFRGKTIGTSRTKATAFLRKRGAWAKELTDEFRERF